MYARATKKKERRLDDVSTACMHHHMTFKRIKQKRSKGIIMAKCPNCKKDQNKPKKTWKYGQFFVQAYACILSFYVHVS